MIRFFYALLFVLVATFFSVGAAAQGVVVSLDEVLAAADSGNAQLQAARTAVAASAESLKSARRSAYTPDFSFNASIGYLGNGYGWGRDSNYSFSVRMPHFSAGFGVEAQQVVYAGGALAAAVEQARLAGQLAELDYERQRQDVRLRLVCLYLDLYRSMRQLEIYDSNIALCVRLIADITAKREQGTALKNDLTRYELQLANLRMQRSTVENDLAIANHSITTLAGLPADMQITPDSSFLTHGLVSANAVGGDGDARPVAVRVADAQVEMASVRERRTRAAMLPYLSVVAHDELTGPVTIDITPYNVNYNYWFVGLSLNYSFSSLWKTNRQLRSSKLEKRQSQYERQATEQATGLAIDEANIRIAEAHENLQTKEKGLLLAQENYALVANRFAADLALLLDMLDASNQKLAAELDLVNARLSLAYRLYMLEYIKGTL